MRRDDISTGPWAIDEWGERIALYSELLPPDAAIEIVGMTHDAALQYAVRIRDVLNAAWPSRGRHVAKSQASRGGEGSMKTLEQMAEEAGISVELAKQGGGIDTWYGNQYLPDGALQRFAALVAERCAAIGVRVCQEHDDLPDRPSRANAILEAILAGFPKP